MNIFETVLCIVIPLICMGIGICVNIYSRFSLQRKGDNKSKIKAEAMLLHQIEDHNRRFMQDSRKFSLWQCENTDDSILKNLQTIMECRKKDGKE